MSKISKTGAGKQFSFKSQIVSIWILAGIYTRSLSQLHTLSLRWESSWRQFIKNGCGCALLKLYLLKEVADQSSLTGHNMPKPSLKFILCYLVINYYPIKSNFQSETFTFWIISNFCITINNLLLLSFKDFVQVM